MSSRCPTPWDVADRTVESLDEVGPAGRPTTGLTGGTSYIGGGPPTGGTDESESDMASHPAMRAANRR